MGLFNKKDSSSNFFSNGDNSAPVFDANEYSAQSSSGITLDKASSGGVSLTKNKAVSMTKTPVIRAKATWSSNTDYDLYALVLLKSGEELIVSTFGSDAQPNYTMNVLNGAIKHNGDVGREANGDAQEVIEVRMTDDVLAVVPVAYSAQSNGTGSFRRYNVSLEIDNGAGERVLIDASNANDNDTVYTVAIGAIVNGPNGDVIIKNIESYSCPGSESRPAFVGGKLYMDRGSRNLYK